MQGWRWLWCDELHVCTGYALRTEKTYIHWIRRYIYFIERRHPAEAGAPDVRDSLTYLAADRQVSINTQKVALNALVCLYHKFLNRELGELGFTLASKQRSLPIVLTVDEVRRILAQLEGRNRLIIEVLYGSGLRVNECLQLRLQAVRHATALRMHPHKNYGKARTAGLYVFINAGATTDEEQCGGHYQAALSVTIRAR